jgi:hypothetical protein
MAERLKAPVLKTGVGIPPRVRIPLSPIVMRRNLLGLWESHLIIYLITLTLKIMVRRKNYATTIQELLHK